MGWFKDAFNKLNPLGEQWFGNDIGSFSDIGRKGAKSTPKLPQAPAERKYETKYDQDPASPTYGLPLEYGYTDDKGQWVVSKDYRNIAQNLNNVRDTQFPTFSEYVGSQGLNFTQDVTQNPAYGGLQSLTEELRQGPSQTELSAADEQAKQAVAAQSGITPEQYEAMMGGLTQSLSQGVSGQQGLTPEERAAMEQNAAADLEYQQKMADRTLNAMMVNGSAALQYYAKADEYLRGIRDSRLKSTLAVADADLQKKSQEFESKKSFYDGMLNAGMITRQQYLDSLQQGKAAALQGYATQINSIMAQNQQYLSMYGAELDRINAHVMNQYNAINAEMGIDQAVAQRISTDLSNYYASYNVALQTYAVELEAYKAQQENGGFLKNFLGPLATVAGVALMFTPGGQVAGATLVASGLGASK